MADVARLTRRNAIAGTIAALLGMSGRSRLAAKAEFVTAAGGNVGTDFLALDPASSRFEGLTQGFNRRWRAPKCAAIFVPLTEAGVTEALMRATAWGPGNFRVRGGGHCYE